MKENLVTIWDKRNEKASGLPIYDLWLDNYYNILVKNKKNEILDLGCGIGSDTLYLRERGYKVLSCDISKEALENVKKYIYEYKVKQMDMTERFPFADESYYLIIADLSLHYFSKEDTIKIMKEIKRILKFNGVLLARVHSVKELVNESAVLEKVENNLYYRKNELRRYFSDNDIKFFFSIIGDIVYSETEMFRNNKLKIVYEVMCTKR